MSGGWLMAVVATESLAVLAAILTPVADTAAPGLLLAGYALWSVGVLLYAVFITFITARLLFRPVASRDLTPPYWINMGATAITALAGSELVLLAGKSSFLSFSAPFVQGLTVAL